MTKFPFGLSLGLFFFISVVSSMALRFPSSSDFSTSLYPWINDFLVESGGQIGLSPSVARGGQLGSFRLDRSAMLDWLGLFGETNEGDLRLRDLWRSMLLKGSQSLHQFLNNKEQFPLSLPSPLNKLQGAETPKTLEEVHDLFVPVHQAHVAKKRYPYVGFMPSVDAIIEIGGPDITYDTQCFEKVTAYAVWMNSSFIRVTIQTFDYKAEIVKKNRQSPASAATTVCEDSVLILALSASFGVNSAANFTYEYFLDIGPEIDDNHRYRKWIVENRGVLITRIPGSFFEAFLDMISTVVLEIGFLLPKIEGAVFEANTQFVQDYVAFNSSRMGPYNLRSVAPNNNVVATNFTNSIRSSGKNCRSSSSSSSSVCANLQSGDVLMIMRPDGLDPMIGWAEGSAVGHTAMIMKSETNSTIFVCESTAKDAYWPKNGVQCHEWDEWISLAEKAQYNVVLLPLNDGTATTASSSFNVSAAWEFFYEQEGFNYGYLSLLGGWLDMKHGDQNSPCIPPHFDRCLTRHLMTQVVVLIDEIMGNSTENLVRQLAAHRIGVWPQQWSVGRSIKYGQEMFQMYTLSNLYSVVEQDDWRYNTTRYGKPTTGRSMVCNVFVCHMLKAGGVFDSIDREIQCGESNLWTLYSSNIWDASKMGANRPEVCKTADPDNLLCQITGNWTLNLHPDLNSRAIYANMSNHCPSIGPNYYYPKNC